MTCPLIELTTTTLLSVGGSGLADAHRSMGGRNLASTACLLEEQVRHAMRMQYRGRKGEGGREEGYRKVVRATGPGLESTATRCKLPLAREAEAAPTAQLPMAVRLCQYVLCVIQMKTDGNERKIALPFSFSYFFMEMGAGARQPGAKTVAG